MTTESINKYCETNEHGYNGWENRPTWATSMWFNNDRGLYFMVIGCVNDCKRNDKDRESAKIAVIDLIREYVVDELEKVQKASPMIHECICNLTNIIDFDAIAEGFLEDFDIFTKQE